MPAASPTVYTNEASPEYLRTLDRSPFTEEQLAGFNEEAMAVVDEQRAYALAHPPAAIYRVATEGSQSREGGVIQRATGAMKIALEKGVQVAVAQQGDCVVYSDGSTAQIITASGEGNSHFALVGSQLDNGDEIINTPQAAFLIIVREGVPLPEGFLQAVKR